MTNAQLLQLALARAQARATTRHFLVGAVAIRRDGAIVTARNDAAPHPAPSAHAEARLLRKTGRSPIIVLVVRVTRDGEMALARPCESCQRKLRAIGALNVYYTTKEGLEKWT